MFNKYRPPQYKYYDNFSEYLKTEDGKDIAVDVFIPAGLENITIPAVITFTRYWRVWQLRFPFNLFMKAKRPFTQYGFAHVCVDVRGSGASFGHQPHPWSSAEIRDAEAVLKWVSSQNWCNGKIGLIGNSYEATYSELTTAYIKNMINCVIPTCNLLDSYSGVAFPGGVYNEWFLKHWAEANSNMDCGKTPPNSGILGKLFLKGVKPVKKQYKKLKQALAEHLENNSVYEITKNIIYRDDEIKLYDHSGMSKTVTIDDFSIHTHIKNINDADVPVFAIGGWFDACVADSIIKRFNTYKNPFKAMIGSWNHGLNQYPDPYNFDMKNPYKEKLLSEIINFFDINLNQHNNSNSHTLKYYTIGEGLWKETNVFPLPNTDYINMYLSDNNRLSYTMSEQNGFDEYQVNYEATTGKYNRWHTQLGDAKVIYNDRSKEDRKLLTYTSDVLKTDIEITGYINICLYLSTTSNDGAVFVYFEDISPCGKVIYISEGILRFIHRKHSTEDPPYYHFGTYHSFKKADSLPLIPNDIMELSFTLQPISVLLRKGHRIRISIAGHDKDTFRRLPEKGEPVYTIYKTPKCPSHITLPVITL